MNLRSCIAVAPLLTIFVFGPIFSFYGLLPSAQAQVFVGPANSATGGAGRASVSPIEGPYLNPASLAHLNKFYFGATGFTDPDNRADRSRGWSAHLTDATPDTLVSASLGYLNQRREFATEDPVDEQDINLALGGRVYDSVAFGLSGHRLIQDSASHRRQISDNMGVGLLITPISSVGIGLVGYDLLNTSGDVPSAYRLRTTYALGLQYIYDFLRLKADLARQVQDNPNGKLVYMAGLESFIFEVLAIRIGFQRDELADRKVYSAGLGFVGPRFSLDYAAQIIDGQSGARHMIDLWAAF